MKNSKFDNNFNVERLVPDIKFSISVVNWENNKICTQY